MRVLFVCTYFPPFCKGGGEISTFWQAEKLTKKKVEVIVLAPKYKEKLRVKKQKFKVWWYKIPFKMAKVSPFLFLNPFFVLYLLIIIYQVAKREKIDIIHCQGKYSVASSVLAKVILKIPLIITLRDYGEICNHGFCLYKNKKSCNFLTFYKRDFLFYFQHYVKNKNVFTFFLQMISSYAGRVSVFFLTWLTKKADSLVCISRFVKEVYIANGFKPDKLKVIYNLPPFTDFKYSSIPGQISRKLRQYKYKIIYAGKLSLGKGADILIDAAKDIIKIRKDILFIFCGNIYYPIKKNNFPQMFFLDRIENKRLLKIMSLSDLVCVPSVWPEPLSRVTIEAFFLNKPVLSSTAGGLPELVSKKRGWLFRPEKKNLKKIIFKAIEEQKLWSRKGERAKEFLLNLERKQMQKLLLLYQSII